MDKIILCGGGSLGHCTPNLAIYENLKDKYQFVYIGTKNGTEKEIVKNYMPYIEIDTPKFIRKFTFKNLLIPFKLIKSIFFTKKILKIEKPALIFSKGGFVSVPVILAGSSLKIPCITHESDLKIGLANKIIAKKCKYLCTSFIETGAKYNNAIYTGTPIRNSVFNGNFKKIEEKIKKNAKFPTILVLGGSLGSLSINSVIKKSIDKLDKFNIIHITGKNKLDDNIFAPYYNQIEFAYDIENYYAIADLVITRGGSNTLFELLALKKRMIIIPLPLDISRGDQIDNAKEFAKTPYATILYEENLNSDNLIRKINEMLNNTTISNQELNNLAINGTKTICDLISSTIQHK